MTAKWPLPFLLVLGVTATRAAGPSVTIDAASPWGKVSPLFYGLMTEEINHAYDGGLYAELVRNRAFLDDPVTAAHWSLVQADGSTAPMALDPKEPLNATIGTSLRLTVTEVLMSVTRDSKSGMIYAKLVNASDADAPVQIILTGTGSLASTLTALTLSADPQATNAIDTPERVVPVKSTVTGVKSGFTYTVPKHGIVVLTMRTR